MVTIIISILKMNGVSFMMGLTFYCYRLVQICKEQYPRSKILKPNILWFSSKIEFQMKPKAFFLDYSYFSPIVLLFICLIGLRTLQKLISQNFLLFFMNSILTNLLIKEEGLRFSFFLFVHFNMTR